MFQAGPRKKCLGRYDLGEPIRSPPVADGDVIYASTAKSLWALRLSEKAVMTDPVHPAPGVQSNDTRIH